MQIVSIIYGAFYAFLFARKREFHRKAFVGVAFYFHTAVMEFYNFIHYGKPDSHTFSRTGFFYAVKFFPHQIRLGFFHAVSIIRKYQRGIFAIVFIPYGKRATITSITQKVGEKVMKHL